jgi:hypothetical protein
MAWGNFLLDSGFNSASVLTKYRAVKLSAAETVTAVTAITDRPIGFSQFDISAAELAKNKGASVRVWGVTEAECSGVINVGDMCTLETDGRVSALVGASGKRIVGQCVGDPSATAGDRISLLIILGGGVA